MKIEVIKEFHKFSEGSVPCRYKVKIIGENAEDLKILKKMAGETWIDCGLVENEYIFRF